MRIRASESTASKKVLNDFYLNAKYHASLVGTDVTPTSGSHIGTYREKVDFCIFQVCIAKGKVFDIGCGQGGVPSSSSSWTGSATVLNRIQNWQDSRITS